MHQGRTGLVSNECAYSVESSVQGIWSNSFLWKQTNCLVVIQTWSWRGKHVVSARAGCRKQTLSDGIEKFRMDLLNVPNIKIYKRVRSGSVHNFGTCKENATVCSADFWFRNMLDRKIHRCRHCAAAFSMQVIWLIFKSVDVQPEAKRWHYLFTCYHFDWPIFSHSFWWSLYHIMSNGSIIS